MTVERRDEKKGDSTHRDVMEDNGYGNRAASEEQGAL